MKTRILFFLLTAIASHICSSQTGHGFSFDNYGGVYLLANNPAHSVQSKHRWQINGLSYNNLNFTDSGKIELFDYLEAPTGFDGITYSNDFNPPNGLNNMHVERDWLLPSAIYTVNERLSIGILLRSRAFMNYSNFSGQLWKGLANNFDTDYTNDPFDFTSAAHNWSEVGLNFSFSFNIKDRNFFKIGATGKMLLGQGALFLEGEDIVTSYPSEEGAVDQVEIRQGTIRNLSTFESTSLNGMEPENIFLSPFSNFLSSTSSGFNFGGDVGLVYERRPSTTNRVGRDGSENSVNLYKLKVSVAITDLGQITYDQDPINNNQKVLRDSLAIQSSFSVPATELETNGLISVLQGRDRNEVARAQPRGEVQFALPTAANLNVDWLLKNDWNAYLNVNYVHPIRENGDAFSNQRMQILTLTPRWEEQKWSVYVPFSYGIDAGFDFGLGFRWRYLTVGSGAVLGFLQDQEEKKKLGHVYFGVNYPIFEGL